MKNLLRSFVSIPILFACLARAATVGTFSGGDPGEGLDLQGNFTYAVNVGTTGPAGKVGDATFTSDNSAGVQVIAQNEIAKWHAADFGSSPNDDHLEFVLNSIRWSAAPAVVTVKLKVEKGVDYKLQLLFAEDCCPGRGFNVVVAGKTEITNFMPGPTQAGTDDFASVKNKVGAVITHEFKAASDELEIVLDGPSADSSDITDHNAILNGFTLERITPVTDDDKDGLRDDWEKKYFGNLAQGPNDDPDQDGLTNLEEQTLGTDPTKPDSDGDGLSDGDEVHKYKTDPLNKDTDGDGLNDGMEVNLLKTDPTKTDSDGDSFSDGQEFGLGTDPADKNSKPIQTQIGIIKGGDAGEGLDLDGNFIYALSMGAGDDAAVKVRDANFMPLLENEVPGATLNAKNTIANWYAVNYGDSDNDKALAAATHSIRWSPAGDPDQASVILTLENLEVGAEYKLQLMFGEDCCNRGFDVFLDDALIVKDFNPGTVQGGIGNHKQEALITRLHFAKKTTIVIRLDGANATSAFNDHNAILSAVTVEKVAGNVDSDNDGLPDEWEKLYFGDLKLDGKADPDGDGISNADEYKAGTNPLVKDTIDITRQPASTSVGANTRVTFSIEAIPHSSLGTFVNKTLAYQWQRASKGSSTFTDISGAKDVSFATPTLQLADDGAKYRVQLFLPGQTVTSAEATLTVTPDVTPPSVVSIEGSDTFDTINLVFNEKVDAAADNKASFSSSGGLTISSVTRTQDDPTLVTLKTSKQAEDTEYTVTVINVKDTVGNPIAAGSQIKFRSWKLVAKRVKLERFTDILGNSVQNLLDDPKYQNAPDAVAYLEKFSFGEPTFGNTYGEAYGSRLKAFVIPTESASYDFFIRSDDASQLYLSSNDTFPVPGTDLPIAEETGCCQAFQEPGATQTTATPISLQAGKKYAILALHKEGVGGDWLQVAWRKVGDKTAASALQPLTDTVWYWSPPQVIGTAPSMAITKDAQGNVVLTFDGTLQAADSVTGPYADVSGASPQSVKPGGSAKFYRSVRK